MSRISSTLHGHPSAETSTIALPSSSVSVKKFPNTFFSTGYIHPTTEYIPLYQPIFDRIP
jgi:hypothetical protein